MVISLFLIHLFFSYAKFLFPDYIKMTLQLLFYEQKPHFHVILLK